MKTTDGHECLKGHYYYLENGECVCLNDFAITGDGQDAFMINPFYEGETMTVTGAGGYHQEITCQYEHEGEERLVRSLFKVAPTEKLCSRYATKLREIEQLSLSLGLMQRQVVITNKEINAANTAKKEAEKAAERCKRDTAILQEYLDKLQEEHDAKMAELSAIEDVINNSVITKEIAVDAEKLQYLTKRDFKLQCLENGGVDNWEWYGESLVDYRKRYPV